ncbi:UDP-N-acetylmuramoyl-tripeptide--D-alanyl-D-alanine ligase [Testudinibacter sp. TR-2022]|uniref:UDP-N-acetylmuramoyl-tripeptide--D-alanyl-D- alanine ligase n=1 Tax=Testudinibacter sp. TR-2022 TaxID=2585029 RepID=UPI00111B0CB6|nr:UDP-N-acetylmuramoyl-tripeptide--D-alanyl-D-alanine ligase [Testudinibacter sp. TR-2022]TNH03324.1 UDP-N-acetylmuramoyl-tripeptide--D-alanyl-D-alanine ligase [Pasteurellaceae bacterium Phil31]TNH08198.1 UDP-N-acetylmuramoyl-tripeptide--D-alanyl-D-alanine ligase [Testudinibacter sp. TR-2022]TNH11400.1 UDP-N-acetylmuramoyl-tripeptide--D-alanyl-D-alanine ligase [Testudinibacter sp. TR-2022]TNH13156.1 UDP-N-acetylmuramoyl-tripeptide--D-alanyl-D-alanine ligase [Testudinibacter sp. TR-2022]TNH171
MMNIDIRTLAEILSADCLGDASVTVKNITTDTRKPSEQALFFALKGTNFDAHNYLTQAVEQGAAALVVEHANATLSVPQLVVPDTRLALGQLAKWWKATLAPKTVAMTGSSGKTTVKEMTASILANCGEVLFTQGNFNNDIGVPLTLLRLQPQHQFAVVELGANHAGEIAYTTALVQPDVALVNNVAPAHLEGFGSLDGVAQAKGEIYRGLAHDGCAVINLDCHYLDTYWQTEIGTHRIYSFSVSQPQADFYAANIDLHEQGANFQLQTPQGEVAVNLPYLGIHNVANALAATALSMLAGATLSQVKCGLEKKQAVKGRLFPIEVNPDLLLLDDTYNANVDSMQSAVNVLKNYSGFRIFVVGDMAELGENSQLCHQQVADFTQHAGLNLVVSFGTQSEVISRLSQGKHFSDKADLILFLQQQIAQQRQNNKKVVLLAKGSRSMKMEEIIDLLKDKLC